MGIGDQIFGSNRSLFSLTKCPGNTCCWIIRVCSALPPTDRALKGLSSARTASPCSVLPVCLLRERSGHTEVASRFIMHSQGRPCSLGMKLLATQLHWLLHGMVRACKTAKCFQEGVYTWLCVQIAAQDAAGDVQGAAPSPSWGRAPALGAAGAGLGPEGPRGASSLGHSMALCLCNRGPGGLFQLLGVS